MHIYNLTATEAESVLHIERGNVWQFPSRCKISSSDLMKGKRLRTDLTTSCNKKWIRTENDIGKGKTGISDRNSM